MQTISTPSAPGAIAKSDSTRIELIVTAGFARVDTAKTIVVWIIGIASSAIIALGSVLAAHWLGAH